MCVWLSEEEKKTIMVHVVEFNRSADLKRNFQFGVMITVITPLTGRQAADWACRTTASTGGGPLAQPCIFL